ncbi:hypothetical protein B5807_05812 [Epicoccum nigrum]|uniref:Protein kinase domain-containing protein n=1 Tax=Epicoccum nigrum TaxID=105696 RepID=A0A1Y2M376_EPING|nr:hypothetical protein B5807_05812 [Epicoccum nigrum]
MLLASRFWKELFRRSWKPLAFPTDGFTRIPADVKIEEETIPGYVASRYYPVRIGEILHTNYQLARDLSERRHVALKLFTDSKSIGAEKETEINVFNLIDKTLKIRPGRKALDTSKRPGEPVLCDFGLAQYLDDGIEHRIGIQPNVYRAPEIILDIPWTYSVDIWNVGCMIWDAFEGVHLFTGHDPELKAYRGRAHFAEMTGLLGPLPPSLLARAALRSKFYSDHDEWCAGTPLPDPRPLEKRLTVLSGEDRDLFLRFMRKVLQWEPEKCSTAAEFAKDEWILKHAEW